MTDTHVLEAKDAYIAAYEEFKNRARGAASPAVAALRRSGIERFSAMGFPTLRDEQWRQTNVAPIVRGDFRLADGAVAGAARRAEIEALVESVRADREGARLVFVNGRFDEALSSLDAEPGLRVAPLAAALESGAPGVARLGEFVIDVDDAFIALNTAFLADGALIEIDAKAEIRKPIHIIYVGGASAEPTVAHPRALIMAGEASRCQIIETYVGPAGRAYFTNAVTEIHCAARAYVDHYRIQRESEAAFHVGALEIKVQRDVTFLSHAISYGAALGRNNIHAYLDGEHVELTLNGLYFGHGRQHLDTHTKIDHAKPNCRSHELYKGILEDDASGVFNGWIHVHQDAQKTDAIQSNRSLLLSERATINTQPQLEIYADDVKCTHGATIGKLPEEALFYFRSRGISAKDARALMIYAFANEIIQEITEPAVRARLEDVVLRRYTAAR